MDVCEVSAFSVRKIALVPVHQPQWLAHRFGHIAPAFVARAAALGDADLRPELLLIQPEPAPDLAWIQNAVKKFHGALRFVMLYVLARTKPEARSRPSRVNTIGIIVDQTTDPRKCKPTP